MDIMYKLARSVSIAKGALIFIIILMLGCANNYPESIAPILTIESAILSYKTDKRRPKSFNNTIAFKLGTSSGQKAYRSLDYYLSYLHKEIMAHGSDSWNAHKAYYKTGTVYHQQKQFSQAIKYYELGLDLEKDTISGSSDYIHYKLALAYRALGDYDRALELFTLSLDRFNKTNYRADPSVVASAANVGQIQQMLGQHEMAIESSSYALQQLEELIEGPHPLFRLLHNDLSVSYLAIGKKELSEKHFTKAKKNSR